MSPRARRTRSSDPTARQDHFISQLAGNLPPTPADPLRGRDITRFRAEASRKGTGARSDHSVYPGFTRSRMSRSRFRRAPGTAPLLRDRAAIRAHRPAARCSKSRLEERINVLAGNLRTRAAPARSGHGARHRPRLLSSTSRWRHGIDESQHMIGLLASLKPARPCPGRARHGRGVPPRRPDFSAGVRAVIASDSPERIKMNQGGAKRPTGRGRLMLEVRDLQTAYGRSQVLLE